MYNCPSVLQLTSNNEMLQQHRNQRSELVMCLLFDFRRATGEIRLLQVTVSSFHIKTYKNVTLHDFLEYEQRFTRRRVLKL